jgi:hypothetical protein
MRPHSSGRAPTSVGSSVTEIRSNVSGKRTEPPDGAGGLDIELVAAQEVDVPVLERGESGDVLVLEAVALRAELAELDDGGVQIARGPQDHGVEDESQTGELVLLPVPVRLPDLAPAAGNRSRKPDKTPARTGAALPKATGG